MSRSAELTRARFHPNQLVVVDEASMVSTLQLSALVQQARDAGAKVLLVGDPGQRDAIDAGGILGWLDRQGKTVRLSSIWRFEQVWEQDASLMLRAGDFAAIGDHERHGRLQHGTRLDMVDQTYLSWQADIHDGKSSILIAADNDTVSMLNQRAQADRVIQGYPEMEQMVPLGDGMKAGAGDTVIARCNDRHITRPFPPKVLPTGFRRGDAPEAANRAAGSQPVGRRVPPCRRLAAGPQQFSEAVALSA